jgi:hypothetical protein
MTRLIVPVSQLREHHRVLGPLDDEAELTGFSRERGRFGAHFGRAPAPGQHHQPGGLTRTVVPTKHSVHLDLFGEEVLVPRFRRFDADTRLVDASLRRIYDEARNYVATPCVLPP